MSVVPVRSAALRAPGRGRPASRALARLTRRLQLAGARAAGARRTAGAVATDKEAYVCSHQAGRPQLSRDR
jgi:hypothetical protein